MIAPATIAREARATPPKRAVLRCAVYSRVSTDEQAALEYNSLQAQEEICAGYVAMRGRDPGAEATWHIAETYRDAGYSGGTLERPALRRLLQDVEAGRIQVVVVYKIDRLSRSISQFYQVWSVLERKGVDLVSATQDLNTSTSQGRLMLNMLLAFAQHEREQVSERTRDKIRAARLRGKWTGGVVPLGYDLRESRLLVNEAEAAVVRQVFEVYLETSSLTRTVEELSWRGITMKGGAHQNGSRRSGRPWDKPSLLRLLRYPVYAGFTRSNGSLAQGEHEAIVDRGAWERVQQLLTRNGLSGYQGERADSEALLKGLLYCAECGCRMTPTYTSKGDRRFRYYVCASRMRKGAHACPTGRVTAHFVEKQVIEQIRAIGRDPSLIAETVRQARVHRDELAARLEDEGKALRRELRGKKASLGRLDAKGGDAAELQTDQERIATIEARLIAIPTEIPAAKRAKVSEESIRYALEAFGPVWEALWPRERARVIGLLVEGIDYDGREKRIEIWFRGNGIGSLARTAPGEPACVDGNA